MDIERTSGTGFQPVNETDTGKNVRATPADAFKGHGPLKIRQGAYLPHWTRDGCTYAVTFRLADSLPRNVLERWVLERESIVRRARAMGRDLSDDERRRLDELHSERIESYLDAGHGACHMNDPRIAALVQGALTHFDGNRYDLVCWAVMPNHVHVIFRPTSGHEISAILRSWKGFTGSEANKLLGTHGPFWQPESFDHLIRDGEDFDRQVRYVLENPAKAGLHDWPWHGLSSP